MYCAFYFGAYSWFCGFFITQSYKIFKYKILSEFPDDCKALIALKSHTFFLPPPVFTKEERAGNW